MNYFIIQMTSIRPLKERIVIAVVSTSTSFQLQRRFNFNDVSNSTSFQLQRRFNLDVQLTSKQPQYIERIVSYIAYHYTLLIIKHACSFNVHKTFILLLCVSSLQRFSRFIRCPWSFNVHKTSKITYRENTASTNSWMNWYWSEMSATRQKA